MIQRDILFRQQFTKLKLVTTDFFKQEQMMAVWLLIKKGVFRMRFKRQSSLPDHISFFRFIETMRMLRRISSYLCFLMMFVCLTIVCIFATNVYAETCEQWVAKVVSAQGTVEARRVGETSWQQVQLNDTYCAGDMIRVQDESRADMAFANQPLLRLDENSAITLGGFKEEESTLASLFKGAASLDLIKGAAHFFSRLPRNLEVRTAFVNAGVEGTEFFIKVADNKTTITVFEGKVLAANDAGNIGLASGQSAVAEAGKAPVLRVVANPRDAVRWALYYPPVVSGPSDSLTNQAAQLLSVGRVDEANSKIKQALGNNSGNSDALSLQSIIAVVQNRKDEALNLANKAVAATADSATSLIALSYAQQANFDLAGARSSLEKAVELKPENALAWARLAELRSSFGDLNKSLDAAQKAVSLDPNLSRTQTVLGFAYLTKIKTAEAREAFNQAIELDQADSLPRLGLGLAKIRDGALEEGRREIEIAASLDSSSSLIRSYLGKAYYEEKRTDLDGREYEIAKELDPNDPTPWFYDAIRKQTTNRPVEALHDLQKAVELNDNRAVYRSKLMLDSDLAARSASLARIYSDLGFQQRALVEGWNSVNTDPTNHSSHRFLADSYSVLPRHEIARVSELLQSQLLQPNNITPIQPQLAESSLNLLSAGGAASASFNEFNPLFNRNQLSVQASGLIGEDSTNGGEAVISGIYQKASFSVGYSQFETDGWRVNADQEDEIANAFVQLELTHKTSIQAEYRNRDNDRGDVQLRFFDSEGDYWPDLLQEDETDTYRIGIRHAFSPGSVLIGNFAYQEVDLSLFNILGYAIWGGPPYDDPPLEYRNIKQGDHEAYSAELEHLFRSERFSIVSGAGIFKIEMDDEYPEGWFWPGTIFPFPDWVAGVFPEVDKDIDHYNVYLYSYLNFLDNLTFTLGASGDFFDIDESGDSNNDLKEDQFNPKIGITWNPTPDTTFRAAAFRTLKRTLITNQTLEPTQVAGFNQFYDDGNATDAWHYGGAVDQKLSANTFFGAELFYRDLDVPYFFQTGPGIYDLRTAGWKEYEGRAYLYWAPLDWLAMRAEYQYEELDRDPEFAYNMKEVKTHRVPLAINIFHPSGLSFGMKATYVNQEGEFELQRAAVGDFTPGEDDFFLVDAHINYRLPKRYGFITIAAMNLLDEEFEYADTDVQNPSIQPGRTIYGKITLAFP
jgi:Flp pilus assembly protein TadD